MFVKSRKKISGFAGAVFGKGMQWGVIHLSFLTGLGSWCTLEMTVPSACKQKAESSSASAADARGSAASAPPRTSQRELRRGRESRWDPIGARGSLWWCSKSVCDCEQAILN